MGKIYMNSFEPIPGFEHYLINKQGQVYSINTELFRKPYKHKSRSAQYLRLSLYSNGREYKYFIHELVLLTFVGSKPYKHECNHLNLDTLDNRVENLEYCTAAENKAHYAKSRRNTNRTLGA